MGKDQLIVVGNILLGMGIVLILFGLLTDYIGIGTQGYGFGPIQIMLIVIGISLMSVRGLMQIKSSLIRILYACALAVILYLFWYFWAYPVSEYRLNFLIPGRLNTKVFIISHLYVLSFALLSAGIAAWEGACITNRPIQDSKITRLAHAITLWATRQSAETWSRVLAGGILGIIFLANYPLWKARSAFESSNYYASSDSLAALLWLQGKIEVSSETAWGMYVQSSALPSLHIAAKVLDWFHLTAYDFQNIMVWANLLISYGIVMYASRKLCKSFIPGVLMYLIHHFKGLPLATLPMGYLFHMSPYTPWGPYLPLTGMCSLMLGMAALFLWLTNHEILAITLTIVLSVLHPATGMIVVIIIGAEISFSTWKNRTYSLSVAVKLLCLAMPLGLLYLWSLSILPPNFEMSSVDWNYWKEIMFRNIPYHVFPWFSSLQVQQFLAWYFLTLSIGYSIWVHDKTRLPGFSPKLVFMLGIPFGLFLVSWITSEFFHSYFLASLYLHKATVFPIAILPLLPFIAWKTRKTQERSYLMLQTLVLMAVTTAEAANWFLMLRIFTPIVLGVAWIIQSKKPRKLFWNYWLNLLYITIAIMVILASTKVFLMPFIAGFVLIGYYLPIYHKPSAPITLTIVGIFLLTPSLQDIVDIYIQRESSKYRAVANPSTDERAEVYQWIRENTPKNVIVLDPPTYPQAPENPDFGYNPLYTHREHFVNDKLMHIPTYMKHLLPYVINELQIVYGIRLNQVLRLPNGQVNWLSIKNYHTLDDERLAYIKRHYPRFQIFVRERENSLPSEYPVVFENAKYIIHSIDNP